MPEKQAKKKVYVKLIKGDELIAKDFTGKSDPYAIISVRDQKKKSKVCWQTLYPRWNQYFYFDVVDENVDLLSISLFDKDMPISRDEDMGTTQFPLNSLVDGFPTPVWLAMSTKGRIKVLITAENFGKSLGICAPAQQIQEDLQEDGTIKVLTSNTLKTPIDLYEAYHLREGDLLLFASSDAFSTSIHLMTLSHWDHVGLVIYQNDDDHRNSKKRVPRILEATERGVKIYPNLISRLEKYHADRIALRRPNKLLSSEQHTILQKFAEEMEGKPYEKSWVQLIKASCNSKGPLANKHEDLSSVFCSELVASCLQRIGWLSKEIPSNAFSPRDFSNNAKKQLPLLDGVKFYNEIYIATRIPDEGK